MFLSVHFKESTLHLIVAPVEGASLLFGLIGYDPYRFVYLFSVCKQAHKHATHHVIDVDTEPQ